MVLRVWFPKQKHHITQEFVRHVDSWTPIRTTESETLRDGTGGQCFNSPLGISEACSERADNCASELGYALGCLRFEIPSSKALGPPSGFAQASSLDPRAGVPPMAKSSSQTKLGEQELARGGLRCSQSYIKYRSHGETIFFQRSLSNEAKT